MIEVAAIYLIYTNRKKEPVNLITNKNNGKHPKKYPL